MTPKIDFDNVHFDIDPRHPSPGYAVVNFPNRKIIERPRAVLNGFDISYKGGDDRSILQLKVDLRAWKHGDQDIPPNTTTIGPGDVLVRADFVLRDDDVDNPTPYAGWIDGVVFVKFE